MSVREVMLKRVTPPSQYQYSASTYQPSWHVSPMRMSHGLYSSILLPQLHQCLYFPLIQKLVNFLSDSFSDSCNFILSLWQGASRFDFEIEISQIICSLYKGSTLFWQTIQCSRVKDILHGPSTTRSVPGYSVGITWFHQSHIGFKCQKSMNGPFLLPEGFRMQSESTCLARNELEAHTFRK